MEVKKGMKIKVHYTGTLDDGKVFDSSEGKAPLEFTVGSKQLIKGFDDGVVGMKEGEEKEVKINSDQAYGKRNDELVQTVPKNALKGDFEPKPGMQLVLRSPEGQQMLATIASIEGENMTVDMNHPLAGKDLTFKIKVIEAKEAESPDEAVPSKESVPVSEKAPEAKVEPAPEEKSEESKKETEPVVEPEDSKPKE